MGTLLLRCLGARETFEECDQEDAVSGKEDGKNHGEQPMGSPIGATQVLQQNIGAQAVEQRQVEAAKPENKGAQILPGMFFPFGFSSWTYSIPAERKPPVP